MGFDEDQLVRMCRSGDPRFDGWFVVGVTSTGIYCRPSCPARPPLRRNMRFFPTSAAAQLGGFRACKRCRPDATPGSPEWNRRADVVGRAMRLIADGVVDREGVGGLARRLGYSQRHLNRILTAELGAGASALASAQRARNARILIETTSLPFTQVAFAAGFGSVRQFNDVVREVFASSPSGLRSRAGAGRSGEPGVVSLRMPYREPYDVDSMWSFLARRAVEGVESFHDGAYRRRVRLPKGSATVSIRPAAEAMTAELRLDDLGDLAAAVQRCRNLLDLDADPVAIEEVLGDLGPRGARLPGSVEGWETAARAVVGQQVSVASARRTLARIAALCSDSGGFPSASSVAELDPAALPLPEARARTLVRVAAAVAGGELNLGPGADRDETRARLLEIPGVGPWTADYIRMRALGDPDVWLAGDLIIRRESIRDDPALWAPWRSYATVRLWGRAKGTERRRGGATR